MKININDINVMWILQKSRSQVSRCCVTNTSMKFLYNSLTSQSSFLQCFCFADRSIITSSKKSWFSIREDVFNHVSELFSRKKKNIAEKDLVIHRALFNVAYFIYFLDH